MFIKVNDNINAVFIYNISKEKETMKLFLFFIFLQLLIEEHLLVELDEQMKDVFELLMFEMKL
jgi:hypothetical protein